MARVNYIKCDKCQTGMEDSHRTIAENNGFGQRFDFCKPCWFLFQQWLMEDK